MMDGGAGKGIFKEIQVEPGQIPTDTERGTWELPGMVAFLSADRCMARCCMMWLGSR